METNRPEWGLAHPRHRWTPPSGPREGSGFVQAALAPPVLQIRDSLVSLNRGKAPTYSAGDKGSIPGSGKSPGEGNGNPFQCCLKISTDRGDWQRVEHD